MPPLVLPPVEPFWVWQTKADQDPWKLPNAMSGQAPCTLCPQGRFGFLSTPMLSSSTVTPPAFRNHPYLRVFHPEGDPFSSRSSTRVPDFFPVLKHPHWWPVHVPLPVSPASALLSPASWMWRFGSDPQAWDCGLLYTCCQTHADRASAFIPSFIWCSVWSWESTYHVPGTVLDAGDSEMHKNWSLLTKNSQSSGDKTNQPLQCSGWSGVVVVSGYEECLIIGADKRNALNLMGCVYVYACV